MEGLVDWKSMKTPVWALAATGIEDISVFLDVGYKKTEGKCVE